MAETAIVRICFMMFQPLSEFAYDEEIEMLRRDNKTRNMYSIPNLYNIIIYDKYFSIWFLFF